MSGDARRDASSQDWLKLSCLPVATMQANVGGHTVMGFVP
jgi:hypothetical protein